VSILSSHWPHWRMHNVSMPAPRPSFARLRFAPASRDATTLDLPREEGLALLEWLGLGRPDFGAIPARELAPRCRRRLWAIERNQHASLRARTGELLAVAEAAGKGMVLFG
jgi:hypothetical protein